MVVSGASSASGPESPALRAGWRWLLAALLALGVVLRLLQYLDGASLVSAELALVHSILARSSAELVSQPLPFSQSAPPAFLLLMKAATVVFGSSEFALRLVPAAAGLASLPLFLGVCRRVLPAPALAPALALFAIAPQLISRAAEAKQYSSDVFAAVTISFLALRWLESRTRGRAIALGAASLLAPWFSTPAAFTVGGVLAALLVSPAVRSAADRRRLLAYSVPALLSLALATLHANAMVSGAGREYLFDYWQVGFVPWSPGAAVRWAVEGLPQPLQTTFHLGPRTALLYAALVPVGWWALWRGNRTGVVLVAAPVLATLVAAAAHLYPFRGRLAVFLAPYWTLAIAASIDIARRRLARWSPALALVGVLILLAPALVPFFRRPLQVRREEARPVLTYLAERRQPGDQVYVFFTGRQAYAYYAPRVGLDPRGVQVGRCGRIGTYRAEVNRFAGTRRLWVFFTHEPADVRNQLIAHLDSIGVRRDALIVPPSASVYGYDLAAAPAGLDTTLPRDDNPRCLLPGPMAAFDPLDSADPG
jgi:hypothetical protein